MSVILGADAHGSKLKDIVKEYLIELGNDVIDVSDVDKDFVDNTLAVVTEVNKANDNLGIMFDAFGAGPFMVATKVKGMIAAEVSDERSAYMTREHNNARIITVGVELVGETLAKHIAREFISADYDGGRHQIRVDMLNKMD